MKWVKKKWREDTERERDLGKREETENRQRDNMAGHKEIEKQEEKEKERDKRGLYSYTRMFR